MIYVFVGGQEKPGGIGSYVNNIGRQLVIQGYSVTVFQFGSSNRDFELDGMKMMQRKAPKNTMLAIPYILLCSLPYIIRNRKNIKIVNFQTTFLAFFPGWLCRLFGVKVCYTIHSFGDHNPKHGKLSRKIMRIISKISVFFCHKNFITVSNSKAVEFRERNGKGCHIIPCGVNVPIEFTESDILDKNGIVINKYFLIICRIDPIKNLDILIKAFIKHKNKGYQLVIGGDYANKYGYELKRIAKDYSDIKFLGPVTGNDKETLLKNCYVNCLVSSSEGMPISLMEAMAYSKACIVSDIPSIREIVTEEQGCWCLVNDIDSLASQFEFVEDNKGLVLQKGQSLASSVFSKYTWRMISCQYIQLCQTLN